MFVVVAAAVVVVDFVDHLLALLACFSCFLFLRCSLVLLFGVCIYCFFCRSFVWLAVCSLVRFVLFCFGLVWFGLFWLDLAWFVLV